MNIYDDPDELKRILRLKNHKDTMAFFDNFNLIVKQGCTPPIHWLETVGQLLVDAGNARSTNHKNPLADALCLTNVDPKLHRDTFYGSIVASFYVEHKNKSLNWKLDRTIKFIEKNTGETIKKSTLRDIFNKNSYLENARALKKRIEFERWRAFMLDAYSKK